MGNIKVSGLKSQERGKNLFYYGDKKVPGVFAGPLPAYSEFGFTTTNATYPYLNGDWYIGNDSLWYDDVSMTIQSGPTPSGVNASWWQVDNLPYYMLYNVDEGEWNIFSGITPQDGYILSTGDTINDNYQIQTAVKIHNNIIYPNCGINTGSTSGFNITIEYENAPLLCDEPEQLIFDYPSSSAWTGTYTKLDVAGILDFDGTGTLLCSGNTSLWYRNDDSDGFNRNRFIARTIYDGNDYEFRLVTMVNSATTINCGVNITGFSTSYGSRLQQNGYIGGLLYPLEGDSLTDTGGNTYSLTYNT